MKLKIKIFLMVQKYEKNKIIKDHYYKVGQKYAYSNDGYFCLSDKKNPKSMSLNFSVECFFLCSLISKFATGWGFILS